ncbi:MAG: hypothetical protein JNK87_33795 [Bryobacterales bacterium]|nr:hypothetical protein [Bryobacterales bacterium]
MKRIAWVVLFTLFAEPLWAARQQPEAVTWEQFQQQVTDRGLLRKDVRISRTTGKRVTGRLRAVTADSLELDTPEASVKRSEVVGVELRGRKGRRGLIGGLVGLAAGVGAAAALSGSQQEGPAAGAVLVLLPIGAVAGYLVGRAMDEPLPRYPITP